MDRLYSTGQGAPLSAMVSMFLLMSALHLPPWVNLNCGSPGRETPAKWVPASGQGRRCIRSKHLHPRTWQGRERSYQWTSHRPVVSPEGGIFRRPGTRQALNRAYRSLDLDASRHGEARSRALDELAPHTRNASSIVCMRPEVSGPAFTIFAVG